MDKMVEDILVHEAELLAKKRSIAEVGRVIDILKKTALDYKDIRFLKDRGTKDPLEDGLTFAPSFYEALSHLPIDKAFSLFETTDINNLELKVSYFNFLTNRETPFYTNKELADLIMQFIAYLKANKSSLLAIGYPAKSFEKSPWLYEYLSRLYPVKIPFTVQDRKLPHQKVAKTDDVVEKDADGNFIFNYKWIKNMWVTEWFHNLAPYDHLTRCLYEEALLIKGLQNNDIKHIEENRAKVFNLKIEILELAYKYICQSMSTDTFWGNCINTIAKNITKDAFQQFDKIETAYSQLFVIDNTPNFLATCLSAVTGGQPNLDTGGINNILAFIFFVETELNIGQMHNAKNALLKLTNGHIPGSYYELVSSHSITVIDEVIKQSLSDAAKTTEFNKFFDERLKTDSGNKFKMLLEVPSKNYDTVKSFADLVTSGPVSFNLDGIPSTYLPGSKKITPIALAKGIQWEDITIKFMNEQKVQIKCKGKTISTDYIKMGFKDTRGRKPNKQWELLRLLSLRNGELAWEQSSSKKMVDIDKTEQDFGYEFDENGPGISQNKGFSLIKAPDKTKKTKQLLSQALKTVFQINNDPFFPYAEVKAYKIRINLIP